MEPKIKLFKIKNGEAVISKDGEFIHVNDVMYFIYYSRRVAESGIEIANGTSDFDVKRRKALEEKIEFLDEFEQLIDKARNK